MAKASAAVVLSIFMLCGCGLAVELECLTYSNWKTKGKTPGRALLLRRLGDTTWRPGNGLVRGGHSPVLPCLWRLRRPCRKEGDQVRGDGGLPGRHRGAERRGARRVELRDAEGGPDKQERPDAHHLRHLQRDQVQLLAAAQRSEVAASAVWRRGIGLCSRFLRAEPKSCAFFLRSNGPVNFNRESGSWKERMYSNHSSTPTACDCTRFSRYLYSASCAES